MTTTALRRIKTDAYGVERLPVILSCDPAYVNQQPFERGDPVTGIVAAAKFAEAGMSIVTYVSIDGGEDELVESGTDPGKMTITDDSGAPDELIVRVDSSYAGGGLTLVFRAALKKDGREFPKSDPIFTLDFTGF
jgi:hypothetical protein